MPEQKPTNKERMREITDSIEQGITELFQTDKYRQYLSTMSRFHHYSLNNTMLIYMQRPDATLVAGFNKWKNQFERHVKKGERGITIIAPTPFKKKIEEQKLDPDTKAPVLDVNGHVVIEEKEVQIPMFRPVKVFDVAQTDGKPLPQIAADLAGNVQQFGVFMEALRCTASVPIAIEALEPDMDGFFSLADQRIAIREGMSEVQTVSATVHEIAHSILHNKRDQNALLGEQYQEVEVFDKPALFSNGRIDRSKLPEGLYCYDLRGSDDDPGQPITIQENVLVNHAATVITAEPVELPESGFLYLGEEGLNFTGGQVLLREFYEQVKPEIVKKNRNTEEVEAESISYAVCQYYGIETGANSFGYIATWSQGKELKELKASLETISKTASALITDIDRHFKEICEERGIDLTAQPERVADKDESALPTIVEQAQTEALYLLDEDVYLHIQKCDEGYDYTLYDAKTMLEQDGGVLENQELTMQGAKLEIMKQHDIHTTQHGLCELALLEKLQAANELPRPPRRYAVDGNGDTRRTFGGKLPEDFTPEDTAAFMEETATLLGVSPVETAKTEPLPDAPEQVLDEYPMPDTSVATTDLQKVGYLDGDLLPLSRDMAETLLAQDLTVYAMVAGKPQMLFDEEEFAYQPEEMVYAISKEDWESSDIFRDRVKDRVQHQEEREQAFLSHQGGSFAIYQLRSGDDLRDRRFEGMEYLQEQGLAVERENYELIYAAPFTDNGGNLPPLDQIYEKFNLYLPSDFGGHSLSMSDIVALRRDGVLSCHYVDSFGFAPLPEFVKPDNYLKAAEITTEDDCGMIDGIINNGAKQPTMEELGQQVREGKTISLMDLADAIQREKQARKKSVVEQLHSKQTQETKKTAPKRSAEREH